MQFSPTYVFSFCYGTYVRDKTCTLYTYADSTTHRKLLLMISFSSCGAVGEKIGHTKTILRSVRKNKNGETRAFYPSRNVRVFATIEIFATEYWIRVNES